MANQCERTNKRQVYVSSRSSNANSVAEYTERRLHYVCAKEKFKMSKLKNLCIDKNIKYILFRKFSSASEKQFPNRFRTTRHGNERVRENTPTYANYCANYQLGIAANCFGSFVINTVRIIAAIVYLVSVLRLYRTLKIIKAKDSRTKPEFQNLLPFGDRSIS